MIESKVFHMQIAKRFYSFNLSFQFLFRGIYSINKNSYLSHSIFESENVLRTVMEMYSFEIVLSPFRMPCLHQLLTLQKHSTNLPREGTKLYGSHATLNLICQTNNRKNSRCFCLTPLVMITDIIKL